MTMVIDHGHVEAYLFRIIEGEPGETIMTEHVSKSKFKAKALEYFRQVEASGEPLIITDNGKPTLEIRPVESSKQDPFETLKGSVLWYDRPFDPAVDEDEWEALR